MSLTGAIMERLRLAELYSEPSEFCDGLRIAADIAADQEQKARLLIDTVLRNWSTRAVSQQKADLEEALNLLH